MDASTPPQADGNILGQVGELIFWTLISGVLATLSLAHATGWMTSSSSQVIYILTVIWVLLTVARYLRLRDRLLGGSKSEWIANVMEGSVGVTVLGVTVVFLAALYGAVTADVLGIRSSFVWVGAGAAAVALAFAAAVWAKRRGWRLVAEHDAPGTTISMGLGLLALPMMLGMFGWAGAATALMLFERFAGTAGPLRQFVLGNIIAVVVAVGAGVLILAGALHAIRRRRARLPHEPNYLQSLLLVGCAIVFLHLSVMLLIGFSGGLPL